MKIILRLLAVAPAVVLFHICLGSTPQNPQNTGRSTDPTLNIKSKTIIDIGSRRELFVDESLIAKKRRIELQFHQPPCRRFRRSFRPGSTRKRCVHWPMPSPDSGRQIRQGSVASRRHRPIAAYRCQRCHFHTARTPVGWRQATRWGGSPVQSRR